MIEQIEHIEVVSLSIHLRAPIPCTNPFAPVPVRSADCAMIPWTTPSELRNGPATIPAPPTSGGFRRTYVHLSISTRRTTCPSLLQIHSRHPIERHGVDQAACALQIWEALMENVVAALSELGSFSVFPALKNFPVKSTHHKVGVSGR
jgi:hypothetical protein